MLHDEHQPLSVFEGKWDAGASLRVYVRRVIVPVFQIYYAHGFADESHLVGLSMGTTF